ncbi:hypothetical protein [Streptomyces europaeiscabiei]|uniref:hypothetical protein n=1 Tax=Streptomyces europaeiscabiei TaxID=146819 RepID=UPI002E2522BA|nr:hypothetical protein OG858_25735 [Streptomyces europaeiscabiei]
MTYEILKVEYERLKEEQVRRIGFRDNLIYVALVTAGAIFAFYFGGTERAYALLIPPFAISVLGWTYLVNDEKISSIGRYIRSVLLPELRRHGFTSEVTLGWENYHRSDVDRVWRKKVQAGVDITAFCVPSAVALAIFFSKKSLGISEWILGSLEGLVVAMLVGAFIRFADFSRDSSA